MQLFPDRALQTRSSNIFSFLNVFEEHIFFTTQDKTLLCLSRQVCFAHLSTELLGQGKKRIVDLQTKEK